MQEPEPVAAEKAPEAKKKVKGGGLFGFFQQDTVYADEGDEDTSDAIPPSTAVIDRAVTKKGVGRKSVKELVARKGKVRLPELH